MSDSSPGSADDQKNKRLLRQKQGQTQENQLLISHHLLFFIGLVSPSALVEMLLFKGKRGNKNHF